MALGAVVSLLRHLDPRLRPLVQSALDAGASLRKGSKHIVLTLPSGHNLVYPHTSRSNTGALNMLTLTRRRLREEGIKCES